MEEALTTSEPDVKDSTVASGPKTNFKTNVAQSLVLLGRRNFDKFVIALPESSHFFLDFLFIVCHFFSVKGLLQAGQLEPSHSLG